MFKSPVACHLGKADKKSRQTHKKVWRRLYAQILILNTFVL
jgi:hypothetical protein